MDRLNVILGLLTVLFVAPQGLIAATPRPLSAQSPVVLLPQIEELEETPQKPGAGLMPSGGPTVEKSSGRDFFPSARSLWRRWRSSSTETRHPKPEEKPQVAQQQPRREVVTVSDLQLEPISETPAPSLRRDGTLSVTQTPLPGPESGNSLPSTNLISPSPEVAAPSSEIVYERQASCDQQMGASPQAVSPRSLKVGKGIRFPHLSNLFH